MTEHSLPRLLQAISLPFIQAELDRRYAVEKLWEQTDRADFLARVGPSCAALVTGAGTGAGAALLDALPAIGLVAVHGVGTDSVDLAETRRRGIAVTNTPGVLTEDVADMAFALMLAVGRGIVANDAFVRAGSWAKGTPAPTVRVSGRALGIVGFGRIGQAIARRASGFGMTIRYTDLRELDGGCEFEPSLVNLAARSDILVLAASAGSSDAPLVDAAVLDALGPEGILINVARGSLVDEGALAAALREGRLGGAGLDVFAREPNVPQALLDHPSVVVQPHQSSATRDARRAMGRLVLDNLAAHFSGAPLLSPVSVA